MTSLNENPQLDNGLLFKFIFFNAIVASAIFLIVLKPHRLFKRFLTFVLEISFKFHDAVWHVYHILFLVILFWVILYTFLKLQASAYQPEPNDSLILKMGKLDKKWLIEMEIWLSFLIITCYISTYVNSIIFTKEIDLRKQIEEKEKLLEEAKKEKN